MPSLALVVALLVAQSADAQQCPLPQGVAPSGIATRTDQQRLEYLKALVTQQGGSIGTWKLVWGGTFILLAVGQIAAAPLFPEADRPDYYWGAAFSALGVTATLFLGPEVFERGHEFLSRAKLATDENRCAVIAEGERLVSSGANDQKFSTSWLMHAANLAVNAGFAAILGFGYKHWTSAAINGIVGTVLSETMVLTTPTRLVSGWREYLEGAPKVTLQPHLTPLYGGGASVGFALTF